MAEIETLVEILLDADRLAKSRDYVVNTIESTSINDIHVALSTFPVNALLRLPFISDKFESAIMNVMNNHDIRYLFKIGTNNLITLTRLTEFFKQCDMSVLHNAVLTLPSDELICLESYKISTLEEFIQRIINSLPLTILFSYTMSEERKRGNQRVRNAIEQYDKQEIEKYITQCSYVELDDLCSRFSKLKSPIQRRFETTPLLELTRIYAYSKCQTIKTMIKVVITKIGKSNLERTLKSMSVHELNEICLHDISQAINHKIQDILADRCLTELFELPSKSVLISDEVKTIFEVIEPGDVIDALDNVPTEIICSYDIPSEFNMSKSIDAICKKRFKREFKSPTYNDVYGGLKYGPTLLNITVVSRISDDVHIMEGPKPHYVWAAGSNYVRCYMITDLYQPTEKYKYTLRERTRLEDEVKKIEIEHKQIDEYHNSTIAVKFVSEQKKYNDQIRDLNIRLRCSDTRVQKFTDELNESRHMHKQMEHDWECYADKSISMNCYRKAWCEAYKRSHGLTEIPSPVRYYEGELLGEFKTREDILSNLYTACLNKQKFIDNNTAYINTLSLLVRKEADLAVRTSKLDRTLKSIVMPFMIVTEHGTDIKEIERCVLFNHADDGDIDMLRCTKQHLIVKTQSNIYILSYSCIDKTENTISTVIVMISFIVPTMVDIDRDTRRMYEPVLRDNTLIIIDDMMEHRVIKTISADDSVKHIAKIDRYNNVFVTPSIICDVDDEFNITNTENRDLVYHIDHLSDSVALDVSTHNEYFGVSFKGINDGCTFYILDINTFECIYSVQTVDDTIKTMKFLKSSSPIYTAILVGDSVIDIYTELVSDVPFVCLKSLPFKDTITSAYIDSTSTLHIVLEGGRLHIVNLPAN
jgi:hypothetical protein